jgi:hypothetical protein
LREHRTPVRTSVDELTSRSCIWLLEFSSGNVMYNVIWRPEKKIHLRRQCYVAGGSAAAGSREGRARGGADARGRGWAASAPDQRRPAGSQIRAEPSRSSPARARGLASAQRAVTTGAPPPIAGAIHRLSSEGMRCNASRPGVLNGCGRESQMPTEF